MVTICIPVLRRYDLLKRLLLSLQESIVQPDTIMIIDNGLNMNALMYATANTLDPKRVDFRIILPREPLGVAASWNAFIRATEEERIITNDDIVFGPQSIERMISIRGDLVLGFEFSCFLLRDSCVEKVGVFDETISPGYAYFEDCDYVERIRRKNYAGTPVSMVNAPETGLVHGDATGGSQTYRAGTPEQIAEHWKKFDIARENFLKRYGAEPDVLEERWNGRKFTSRNRNSTRYV